MNQKLTLCEKLEDLRKEQGLSLEEVAEATGISKSSLGIYENNPVRVQNMNLEHFQKLCKFYGVSSAYLIGETDVRNHENVSIMDLNLDTKSVDFLINGIYNHRLLCELIVHPKFVDFLIALEMYVNGLATINVNTINAIVETTMATIKRKNNLPLEDNTLHELQNSHVDEYDYFKYKVQDILGEIMKDLRLAHSDEIDTAATNPSVVRMLDFENKLAKLSGKDFYEIAYNLISDALEIDPNSPSTVDKLTIRNYLQRSPILGKATEKRSHIKNKPF